MSGDWLDGVRPRFPIFVENYEEGRCDVYLLRENVICVPPLTAPLQPVSYIGPSEVRATSGQHLGGHYFRY